MSCRQRRPTGQRLRNEVRIRVLSRVALCPWHTRMVENSDTSTVFTFHSYSLLFYGKNIQEYRVLFLFFL